MVWGGGGSHIYPCTLMVMGGVLHTSMYTDGDGGGGGSQIYPCTLIVMEGGGVSHTSEGDRGVSHISMYTEGDGGSHIIISMYTDGDGGGGLTYIHIH